MDMTVEVPELPELTFDEASHIYRLNGDIIPSVSKLMEPLKDQCYGGISKRTLENAAIKGSAVHNSIENWIKFGIDDIPSEHRGYFNGFMEWWKQYKPRVFGSEVRIYHTALRMAQCLASSTVVPKEYHGNVGNCMIAIEMASRINTSPMMVMQNLYIVNGRPAWSSQWIIAMINSSRRYKTELQFEFGRDKADGGLSCRAWAEDYSGHKVYGPKITMNMANDEGWTSKNGSKWKTMPDVMIQYRAASFFGRMNCPDMIMGIYSQEEVLDMGELPTDGFALVVDPATGEVTEAEKDEPITQDQRQTLFKMATSAFGQEANGVLKSLLAAEGYESTEGLPTSVYHRITEKVMEMAQEKKPEPEAPQEASDTAPASDQPDFPGKE